MRKSKEEIVTELGQSFELLCHACHSVSDDLFNQSREGKWTPAENFQHLVTATKMTSLAFTLPKFLHVILYGKPQRTSHGFSKVVDNYQRRLSKGAKASGAYVPYDCEQPILLTVKLFTIGVTKRYFNSASCILPFR